METNGSEKRGSEKITQSLQRQNIKVTKIMPSSIFLVILADYKNSVWQPTIDRFS